MTGAHFTSSSICSMKNTAILYPISQTSWEGENSAIPDDPNWKVRCSTHGEQPLPEFTACVDWAGNGWELGPASVSGWFPTAKPPFYMR